MKQFRYYEVAAVIVPGAILLLAANLLWPGYMERIPKLDISVGGLGLFVLIAYVAGQLLQGVGNLIDSCWWYLRRGWPEDRIGKGKHYLVSDRQLDTLTGRIESTFGYKGINFGDTTRSLEWRPVFRQIYAAVQAAGRDERAYIFNSEYGMFRGVAAACLVAFGMTAYVVEWKDSIPMLGVFAAVFVLSIYRMNRFANLYATEVLVQFLAIPTGGQSQKKGED